jgi:sugar phosphate isomerase/epimerase
MKLGAAWYGFGEQTPSNYFEMAAALGLQYAEIPLYGFSLEDWYRYRGTGVAYRGSGDIEGVANAAREAGVRIVSGVSALNIAGEIRGKELDLSGVEFAMAQARRAIDVGAMLDVEVIRLAEPLHLEAEEMDVADPYLQGFAEAFHTLGDYAAERGLRIAIENFGFTADQINRVLDLADHPAVGTLYDPCNYYRHGGDPLAALKKLGKRVYYCHLKDASFPYPAHQPDSLPLAHSGQMQPWWWIRPLGQGNVEWAPILAELATFYTGYICLEHDIRDNVMWGTRTGIAYIKRLAADHDLNIES